MDLSVAGLLAPIVKLAGLIRRGVREAALFCVYFVVIGPASLFHRKPGRAFDRNASTWEEMSEGSSDVKDHLEKL